MTSPRRRGQALNDSSSAGLNPIKARKDTLEELAEVLQRIPHAYQQAEFSPVAQVIRMIEAGDLEASMADLDLHCGEMDACMKRVAAVYESGFSSSLSSYGIIFDHLPPAIEGTASMARMLETAASGVRPQTAELQGLLQSLETTEHVLAMLRKIEDLAQAPDEVARLVEHKQWQAAARAVLEGVEQLLGDDLLGIRALEMLRKRMLDLKNLLPEMLLSELKSYVYLYSPHVAKEDWAKRVAALADGSLKQAQEMAAAEGSALATAPAADSASGGSTTTDDESPKLAVGPSRKRPVQTHRRGKSITGAAPPSPQEGRRMRAGSVDKAAPLLGVAAPGSGGSGGGGGGGAAGGGAGAAVEREEPIDYRHEMARYMHSLIAALHAMDKAASSLNELATGSDAAHKRLIEAEFARAVKEGREPGSSGAGAAPPRHAALMERREWTERGGAVLAAAAAAACERLALVMHHHLIVAAAARALAREKPQQASSKYSPERQWRSIQQALIDVLEHALFDVKSSHIVEDRASAAALPASSSAPDNAPPLFRFSASSAAFSASATPSPAPPSGSEAGSPGPGSASGRKKERKAMNISLTDLQFVASPGQQATAAVSLAALHPSPFCFPAVVGLLRAFDARVRGLSAMLAAREEAPEQRTVLEQRTAPEQRTALLESWLDNFVGSVYIPRLRMEGLRVLQRALAAPLVPGPGGVLSSAAVLLRMLQETAQDAAESPAQKGLFVALGRELVGVWVKHAEQRLLQITLHTETFRRLRGTPVLELLANDSKTFARDFRGIERRYLEGEKMVEADDLIREPEELAGVALLAASLGWLSSQIRSLPLLRDDESVAAACAGVQLSCAASMKLELRHHCFHHLWQLNPMAYHGAVVASEPDPCVRNLALSLAHFQEVLGAQSAGLVSEGLAALIAEMLIAAVARLERIDSAGRHKMQLNVFALQQRLSGSLFRSEEDERELDAVAAYYGLVELPFPRLLRSILEGPDGSLFSLERYEALLLKRDDGPLTADARDALERALQSRRNERLN